MHGFYNMALRINVSQKSFEMQFISDTVLRRNLGGKGLATHLLLRHNPPGVDPLSPENNLIFANGATAGTSIWGSSRYGVYTKSPQTGYFSESYAGGKVADHLSSTGFDAFIFHGAADTPVWIEVFEDAVVFHPAENLWGKNTYETEDYIKDWIKENRGGNGNCGVVCIGPAGESMVTFAVIENDYWRSAGRTGVGTVMGSKKIKAIAFRGNRKKEVADPEMVKEFNRDMGKRSRDDAGVKAYKKMGTPMLVDIMNHVGGFPTRYWQKGKSSHTENINATALHERCDVKASACAKCFIACGRLSTVREGPHTGLTVEGPEYETIYAFGGLCEVPNIEDIIYLNDLCDRLGMDTITAGNLAGLTIEARRQGIIDYKIDYGDTARIAALLEDISARRGIGDLLAQGIKAVAREWGMEDQAIHVKGLEPAGYDPRVLKGMGLAYGSSARGACHLRATFYKPELAGMVDPEEIEGKAAIFVKWEDRLTIFDTFVLCRFFRDLYQWEELATIIAGVTGLVLSEEEMCEIARAITDDTRRFNLQEGLTPEEDHLPKRFYKETLPETSQQITSEQMDQLLLEYYRARGWDEQGRPAMD
ncbi:MAG: aldehyde ferredoxin oxidoreductase family protein [Desulforhopalus sp.]